MYLGLPQILQQVVQEGGEVQRPWRRLLLGPTATRSLERTKPAPPPPCVSTANSGSAIELIHIRAITQH